MDIALYKMYQLISLVKNENLGKWEWAAFSIIKPKTERKSAKHSKSAETIAHVWRNVFNKTGFVR